MSLSRLSDSFKYTDRGLFRDLITIMQPGVTDANGSPGTPTVFASAVPAAIKMLRQQQVNSTDLVQSEVFYDVRIPYVTGLLSNMTVISPTGAAWTIVNQADPDMRQVEIRMTCRSVNDGAV